MGLKTTKTDLGIQEVKGNENLSESKNIKNRKIYHDFS